MAASILNKDTELQREIRDGLSTALTDWARLQISAVGDAAQEVIPTIGAKTELLKSAGMLTYAYAGVGKFFEDAAIVTKLGLPMHVAGLAIDGYKKLNDQAILQFKNELRKTSHHIVGDIQTQVNTAKNDFPTSTLGKKILAQIEDVYNANNRVFPRNSSATHHTIKMLTDKRLGYIENSGTRIIRDTTAGMKNIMGKVADLLNGTRKYGVENGPGWVKLYLKNCDANVCVHSQRFNIVSFQPYLDEQVFFKILSSLDQYSVSRNNSWISGFLSTRETVVRENLKKDTILKDIITSFSGNGIYKQQEFQTVAAIEQQIWDENKSRY